ncbi:MAG: AAA family ATPase [Micromonosporaceae bacterium]
MIRRLNIEGWRAFADLSLDLGEGLTFVVAENGVGKTSLVQAAAWGVYGALSKVDARAARRVGAPHTRVGVDLELPDGRVLAITREVGERGEPVQARLDGRRIDEDGVGQVMAEAFGASREFLSRTTLLPSDAVADDAAGAFHLQAHLRRVFGVDDLQQAAETLGRLHEQAQAAARQVRQASRRAAADQSRLRAQLTEAEAAEARAQAARVDARRVLEFAESQLRAVRDQEAMRAKAVVARQQFAELVADSRAVLGRGTRLGRITRPTELAAVLEAAELAAAEALDEHRRDAATLAGRLVAVRASVSTLHSAEAECPVCRRELSAGDVARAEAGHEREMADLVAREATTAGQVEAATKRLADIRALGRRVVRVPELAAATVDAPADLAAATFAVQAAREDAERLDEQAAAARAHRSSVAAALADEERIARETEAAAQAHRHEAVTSVAAEVMRATADTVLAERIDPLAAEISHRWKRVFGERGSLRLRADGHLVLVRGVHEIPFSQFSSGEKVVALLATRLLVLGASTRASFLWLDEPLEHLDPRNRRITASLMGAAGRHVRQILVTTYEEGLARRLASAASAHLRYVRTPEVH